MADVKQGRWTAEIDGDFVVFLIGARFSLRNPVASALDLGGQRSMNNMLARLSDQPEKGLLGYQLGNRLGTFMVQYWRSFEHLEAFARSKDDPHALAWRTYWQRVGSSTRTGIWHETYLVRAGEYETVYGNMPLMGLAKASRAVPVAEAKGARKRLGRAPER